MAPPRLVTDDTGDRSGATNLAPDCSGAMASESNLWPPSHGFHPITIAGVTDPDGDPVTITVTAITQDELADDAGDGATCPDGRLDASGAAYVRAERSGAGNGRVYRIRFTATDDHGGSCEGAVAVCVPHDLADPATCVDDGQTVNSLAPCPWTPSTNPIPVIDECRCTGPVYARDAAGGLTPQVMTSLVTDVDDPTRPVPRDTCPAGSRIDIRWHAEPPEVIAYRYRLDEPEFVEVGPEVTSVTYHSGTPPDTASLPAGTKVFRLQAVDQTMGHRDTTRRFRLNFDPDTWFAGPDPRVAGGPWQVKPNGERYALLVGGRLPAGGLPGTLLGPDSVRVLPADRRANRTFLEIYRDTVFLRREFDTVHKASWVVFHNGGFDSDSRYAVKVADGIGWLLPDFPGGAVLTPSGPNGSPIGFRSRVSTYLSPNGPIAQPAWSGLYPFFDPNDVRHFPRVAAYQPMLLSGKAYAVQRAEDGDGARDARVDDARRIVEFPRDASEQALRSLVMVFDVNFPPVLRTDHPTFRPRVAVVDTFFSRTWQLELPADDPDPWTPGEPIGGPSDSKTLRMRFKITGQDTSGAPLTFYDPPRDGVQQKYVNFGSSVNLVVPGNLASGPVTLTIELCDCAFCEVNPGEGRCISREIDVYYQAPPVRAMSIMEAAPAVQGPGVSPVKALSTRTEILAAGEAPGGGPIRFRFSLEADGVADLGLYDVAGHRVRRLASGWFPAGEHSRAWDRQNEHGGPVAPGIYFLRLKTAAGVTGRKVFITR